MIYQFRLVSHHFYHLDKSAIFVFSISSDQCELFLLTCSYHQSVFIVKSRNRQCHLYNCIVVEDRKTGPCFSQVSAFVTVQVYIRAETAFRIK